MSFCLPWRWDEYRQLKLVGDESELFLIILIGNWSYLQSFRFVRTSMRPKCKVKFMSCLACIAGVFFGERMLGVPVGWWIRHFGLVRSRRARNKETITSASLPSPSTRSTPHAILPIVTQSKSKIKTIACLTPRKGAFLIIGLGGGGVSANEVFAKMSDIN